MQKACRYLSAALFLACLTGCSYFQFPGVYKIEIQQGNVITQEMVDKLNPGLTKRQVRYVLGTPLITDTFSQDRWDYFYSHRDARDNVTKERLSVLFDGEILTHISGDFVPSLGQDEE